MAGLKIFPLLQKTWAAATVFGVVLLSPPLLAQDTRAPRNGAQHDLPSADAAQRPAPPKDQPALHEPPDESLYAPVSAVADALGISALLSKLGLKGQVASAVGGILIIGLVLAIIFLVWWKLMGRYRITGRRRNEVRRR